MQQLPFDPNSTASPLTVNSPTATPTHISYNTEAPPSIVKKAMNPLPLYNDSNPMLRQRMADFDFNNPPMNVVDFARQLDYTMSHYGGVGLAAPQCGFPYRIFVMAGGLVCINPTILVASEETVREKEGCLSFPALMLPITRPKTINVVYYTVSGERKEQTFTGHTARIFQHEYDHLEGRVFTRLVGSLTLQMAKKKQQKLFKKMKRIVDFKQSQAQLSGRGK